MPVKKKNDTNEIKINRVYDAPLSVVWDAWTDVAQVAQWWGPRGFTLTTHSKDLRTGGHWNYTMHGPDGTDYPNKTKYLEVQKHHKLVYDHGANDSQPALFRVTVYFSEVNGKTKMEMTMSLATVEAATEIRKFIKKAGGDGTWDRLAEYLAKESSGKEKFVINRVFDAPLELMYEVWTDPKHMSQWLTPAGFALEYRRAEIRPGGTLFAVMSGPNGMKMCSRAQYVKLEKPSQIVYTQQFCDENEKVARHPMAPTWPETMLTIVDLTAEGPDQTRVTITWEPFGNVTRQEIETFVKARGGMSQGWTGSLDGLEAYLEKI
jgi:uncharacterized protein YndB with AHSA1/START domain